MVELYQNKFKIAVVQSEIKQWDPEYNLKKSENFIRNAVAKGSNIIIFPEDFLTGPVRGKAQFVDFKSRYRDHFKNLAKKYRIDIVTGSWIECKRTGWYNTTYYIDSNGKIRGRYRKINLWLTERWYLTPGNEVCVFNTKYGKVGLAICWDLAFPEIFRRMVKKGARIIYIPSLWYLTKKGKIFENYCETKHVSALCVARAFENNSIIIYCNAAGKIINKKIIEQALGRSQVTMPILGAVKILDHNKEEMFIQEVDTTILKDAEKAYKIRNDLKKRVLY